MNYPEIDKTGRRYRKAGNIIEYEPTIFLNGVEVPESEADAFREALKKEEERLRKEAEELDRKKPKGICPISRFRNVCEIGCAWFNEGCLNKGDTFGKKCPITHMRCDGKCMLYDNGCKFIKRGE